MQNKHENWRIRVKGETHQDQQLTSSQVGRSHQEAQLQEVREKWRSR